MSSSSRTSGKLPAMMTALPITRIDDENAMRNEYDFSNGKPNPYAKRLKKQITIRIEEPTIEYFKGLAEEMDLPYQTLINLYLRDCAQSRRKLNLKWK
jgi:predicted DNA binding CopG/RHH family protein